MNGTQHKYWIGCPKMRVLITSTAKCHPELVSGSHREPFLVLLRGQILKQVQDDHQLCSVVFCYIEVHKQQKKKLCSSVRKINLRFLCHLRAIISNCQKTRKGDFGKERKIRKVCNERIISNIRVRKIKVWNKRKKDLSVSWVSLKSFWKNT